MCEATPLWRLFSPILLAVSVAGCGIFGPSDVRSLAFLGDSGMPIEVTVPDTVSRNTAFDVLIVYYGSSSCTRLDEVEVFVSGSIATLWPYVRTASGHCTDDLRRFTVRQVLTFAAPGPAEVGVIGRFERRDTTVVRQTIVR